MAPAPPRPTLRAWQALPAGVRTALAVALAYGVAAWAGALLVIPPGFASPLYPAAGIALAAVLVHGRVAVAGLVAGALVLATWRHLQRDAGFFALLVSLTIGAGSVLQAVVAARLVRRHVSQPLVLTEPADLLRFFGWGAFAACTVSATIATLAMVAGGRLPLDLLPRHWLTWWAGDALGTMLLAPLVLTLIGQPRADWAPRRRSVGLSLAIATVLLALGMAEVLRQDRNRLRDDFEREGAKAAASLGVKLQEPLLALQALRSVFVASDDVSPDEMRRASEAWLRPPTHIQALGWSQAVPRAAVPALEARARAEGYAGYRVHDRGDAPRQDTPTVVAIRYIEPLAPNATALGVNALSVPAARAAIERSVASDRPSATGGFRLSQDPSGSRQAGVVVYHALFRGSPASEDARQRAFNGVVFVTLRMDDLLRAAFAEVPATLSVCLIDELPEGGRQRLAGPAGCEHASEQGQRDERIAFADRQWTLRISGRAAMLATADSHAWMLSLVGLGTTGLLAALLLGLTGRTRRIEEAVTERTAALSAEIREREQAEAAMRESEQRFRNIFNTVPIAVVYTDLAGHLQHVNPHVSTLTGFSHDELMRMDLYDTLHPDDAAQEQRLMQELLDGETAMQRGHRRLVRKDGQVVWVQATTTLLRDAEGRPRRLVGVMEDITDHLLLVEAERAREQAESANLAKSEFLSRMSHELRTPLNAMLGFAQLLELDQRHPLAPGQRPWVMQIQQAGWHLLDMINDVLDLSRVETGNVRLQLENLDLEALVEASVAIVSRDAGKRGITIACDFAPGAVAAVGDITRVKQILINLLSNAVKYNIDQGRIEIATQRLDDSLAVIVTDTGLGMTPDQMAQLFQPFNRLGRERSAVEGTGIGLVISRRLAELMGGRLEARSTAGVGSSFVLTLPMSPEDDTVRSDLNPDTDAGSHYHRRVVLYVEDNETNVEVMRGILAQRPQVLMTVAANGLDALAAVRQQPPDVILLDMNLPDIDGLELLRHLKGEPATAGIAVIVVSADALGSQIDSALDAGALRYLTKPVSVTELLRVLDEVLHAVETRLGEPTAGAPLAGT
ncbi:CHASE domain-containing protein [Piscinibacter sakaiensis]|uniref:histidine kinase n=1 Tax=Piscinibacter sakaiensis TaxID=1547922 RepID=A0A0K8P106_PISS1|nr:CHASE domain-containing protein [Piscinibacter sakaiensis]GAP36316.1 hypothetical protein ISF6_2156 [Piscinibacter sakaiensis]